MKQIFICIIFLASCSPNNKKSDEIIINSSLTWEKELNTIMSAYRNGWIDGANAAVHAVNYNEPFGEKSATELMRKDSMVVRSVLQNNKP